MLSVRIDLAYMTYWFSHLPSPTAAWLVHFSALATRKPAEAGLGKRLPNVLDAKYVLLFHMDRINSSFDPVVRSAARRRQNSRRRRRP